MKSEMERMKGILWPEAVFPVSGLVFMCIMVFAPVCITNIVLVLVATAIVASPVALAVGFCVYRSSKRSRSWPARVSKELRKVRIDCPGNIVAVVRQDDRTVAGEDEDLEQYYYKVQLDRDAFYSMCNEAEIEILGVPRKTVYLYPDRMRVPMDKDMYSQKMELPKPVCVRFKPFAPILQQTIKFV